MKAKKRLDYTAPNFLISEVKLDITLDATRTRVESELTVRRQGQHQQSLLLDGDGLELDSIYVDGVAFNHFKHTDSGIELSQLPDAFTLTIVNYLNPQANTALEGLYMAERAFCTQCEAEGFRRITYFMDRPDVLATYTVTARANASEYPYILANGNKLAESVDDDIRTVTWHDPFPKPCYLFALVAGQFDCLKDTFVTASGREVALALFVDEGQLDKADFALAALKRAMRWDEQTFGLEYDLDIYMIVAVDFFNMGAMENKGLNVFNSKFILANDSTATDSDYFNIESVVAHEYFHNWTGNRVTCRDWFQLSLKEGLTVFRDQLFSADMTSKLSTRIAQVKMIKEHQFAEDASAMSHPIRPDEVIEMNNFYTVTVYDKGAEVIRMLWNIVGEEAFKQGLSWYFEQHDGQAVTCDDFVNAIEAKSAIDLSVFRRWYGQSGTPRLSIETNLDNNRIMLKQHTPATADQDSKQPLSLLLHYQCYDHQGENVALGKVTGDITALTKDKWLLEGGTAELEFDANMARAELTSTWLGDFSSPIIIEQSLTSKQLANIVEHDRNAFNRWDAIQQLFSREVSAFYDGANQLSKPFCAVFEVILKQTRDNIEESAEFLSLPSIESLIQQRQNVEVQRLVNAHQACLRQIANNYYAELNAHYTSIDIGAYQYQQNQVLQRRLKNALLTLLSYSTQGESTIRQAYAVSDNMTDTLAALGAAQVSSYSLFAQLMADFEKIWNKDSLVMDKWFALHATHPREDILSQLTLLQQHPIFDSTNPNRVRSLIGSFAFYNKSAFHKADNSGYKYLTDYLISLDKVNPQVASRIVTPLTQLQNLHSSHQQGMREQLSRLLNHKGLSKDVFEKVSKALAYAPKA